MSKREPRTHDFRNPGWGHNMMGMRSLDREAGTFSVMTLSTPIPEEGDTLLWATQYGHAVVTKSRWLRDPDDGADVEGRIVERVQKA